MSHAQIGDSRRIGQDVGVGPVKGQLQAILLCAEQLREPGGRLFPVDRLLLREIGIEIPSHFAQDHLADLPLAAVGEKAFKKALIHSWGETVPRVFIFQGVGLHPRDGGLYPLKCAGAAPPGGKSVKPSVLTDKQHVAAHREAHVLRGAPVEQLGKAFGSSQRAG